MAEIPEIRVRLLIDTNCLGRGILKGIAGFAQAHGNWVFEADLPFFGGDQVQRTPLDRRYVDGVIVVSTDQKVLDQVLDSGIPAAVKGVSEPVPGYVNIVSDNDSMGRMAFKCFYGLGFRRLAFCGYEFTRWSIDRKTAFEACADQAGFEMFIHDLAGGSRAEPSTSDRQELTEWLRSLPTPIGIFAANDNRARDILEACRVAALDVPGQVAVLGVDNNELICDLTNPPLSSIARFFEKAGFEAASTLNRMIMKQGKRYSDIVIESSHVVVRSSTSTLAIDNPTVRKALLYIRSRADKPISVDDVAEAVSAHPRWLYDRFGEILGHTVYEEITRVRIDRITRLLLETQLSIGDIASRLGFRGADHIARYFRRAKGETPRAYRKRYQASRHRYLS